MEVLDDLGERADTGIAKVMTKALVVEVVTMQNLVEVSILN
jgi:hypothetical protein